MVQVSHLFPFEKERGGQTVTGEGSEGGRNGGMENTNNGGGKIYREMALPRLVEGKRGTERSMQDLVNRGLEGALGIFTMENRVSGDELNLKRTCSTSGFYRKI